MGARVGLEPTNRGFAVLKLRSDIKILRSIFLFCDAFIMCIECARVVPLRA